MKKEPSVFILLLLVSFASVSAVLFTPALPEIARFLNVSIMQAQWTITIFIIGYAIGNLPWGPLSNRFGRKPVLYGGISLAIVGSIMIIFVEKFPYFWLFLLGRFLSALGSSVGLKIAFTMIGDTYQHEKAIRKISYFMVAFAIGPGIAIALGGILTERWGWPSTFYCLLLYSVLVFALSTFLPETCQKKDPDALSPSRIVSGYLNIVKNQKLILCSLLMGCGTACIYLFAAEAPFIGIDTIGLTPEQYGLWNFIPPLGLLLSTVISHKFTGKVKPLSFLLFGIVVFSIAAIVMTAFFLAGIVRVETLFLPMPFLYIGLALVNANSSGLALSHATDKSNASAIMNFINMGTSILFLFLIGFLPHQSYLLPLAFLCLACIMLVLRKRLRDNL